MTRPAEGGKHTQAVQCGGCFAEADSFATRFPKWNPRYVAYALANGATDILAFRDAQPNNAGFIAWIAQQRETWRLDAGIKSPYLTRIQEQAFNRWLEAKYAPFAEAAD
jgi:hypothetical protein